MKKFFDEFKEFVARGNAMDLAVGVVIGGAFSNIVSSLVTYIIDPIISLIINAFKKNAPATGSTLFSWTIPNTEIRIGAFLYAIVYFFIVAFVIFCMVKAINTTREKLAKKEEPVEVVSAPTQEELLSEIRDLLKEKNS